MSIYKLDIMCKSLVKHRVGHIQNCSDRLSRSGSLVYVFWCRSLAATDLRGMPPVLQCYLTLRFGKAADLSGIADGWELVKEGLGISGSVQFHYSMVCELSAKKRQKLIETFKVDHAFADVAHMGRKSSWCYVKEGNQAIPDDLDILFAGFECKSFSPLNPTKAKSTLLGSSKSAKSFKGVRDYVRSHKPKTIVLENVQGLLSKNEKEMHSKADMIVKIFGGLGYHGGYLAVNSKDYLLPQNRPRVYFIFDMAVDQGEVDTTRVMKVLRTSRTFCLPSLLGAEDEPRECHERPGLGWVVKHDVHASEMLLFNLNTQVQREQRLKGHFIDNLKISPRAKSSLLIHWELAEKRGQRPDETDYIWDISQEVATQSHSSMGKNICQTSMNHARVLGGSTASFDRGRT